MPRAEFLLSVLLFLRRAREESDFLLNASKLSLLLDASCVRGGAFSDRLVEVVLPKFRVREEERRELGGNKAFGTSDVSRAVDAPL